MPAAQPQGRVELALPLEIDQAFAGLQIDLDLGCAATKCPRRGTSHAEAIDGTALIVSTCSARAA